MLNILIYTLNVTEILTIKYIKNVKVKMISFSAVKRYKRENYFYHL